MEESKLSESDKPAESLTQQVNDYDKLIEALKQQVNDLRKELSETQTALAATAAKGESNIDGAKEYEQMLQKISSDGIIVSCDFSTSMILMDIVILAGTNDGPKLQSMILGDTELYTKVHEQNFVYFYAMYKTLTYLIYRCRGLMGASMGHQTRTLRRV